MTDAFMNSLDGVVAEQILASAIERSYPPRSFIFYEGDPGTSVFIVESGLLRIDRTIRSGRIALLDLAIKGDLIGELSIIDGAPRSATLSTVTQTTVRHIPINEFRNIMQEHVSLKDAMLERLASRIRDLSSQFLETSTLDAPARIAMRLLRLVEIERTLGRLPEATGNAIDLKLLVNQEELGQWSGLTREGAVKGLRTLRSVGLIETGRMRVKIIDANALRGLAES